MDQFDHIFKQKLERFEAKRPDDAWALFEEKLTTTESGVPETELEMLDEIVFEKINTYQAASAPQHWDLLAERMDKATFRFRKVLSWKIGEAVTVAALLLLLLRFGPAPTPVFVPADVSSPQAENTTTSTSNDIAINASSATATDKNQGRAAETPEPETTTADTPPTPPSKETSTTAALPTPELAGLVILNDNTFDDPATSSIILDPVERRTLLLTYESPLDAALSGSLQAERHQLFSNSILPDIPVLAMRAASLLPLQQGGLGMQTSMGKKKTFLNVGMFGGVDYNRVITPPNAQAGIDGLDRYTLGYGGGVSLGVERGRWEFGTGLIYAAKRYEPMKIAIIRGVFDQGYTAEALNNIEINVLNLPVYARFNFVQNSNWRIYASMGASMQVAFEANYYVAYPSYLNLPSTVGQTPLSNSSLGDLTGGWFEGGSFNENSFVTANIGFGLERFLNERISMFGQPTYQHSLGYFSEGLGPTRDRIHSMSVMMGLRVRLNE